MTTRSSNLLADDLSAVPHPQHVSGDVPLVVSTPGPPPVGLRLLVPPQHRHAVALAEAQLVLAPSLVVPQSVDHAAVHHAHLLLDACEGHEHRGGE